MNFLIHVHEYCIYSGSKGVLHVSKFSYTLLTSASRTHYVITLHTVSRQKETQETEIQSEDDDYKETDSLLGDECESENEITENVTIQSRRKRKKKKKKSKERKASLVRTLWSGLFGMNFAIAVICKLLHDALIFIQPQLLR